MKRTNVTRTFSITRAALFSISLTFSLYNHTAVIT